MHLLSLAMFRLMGYLLVNPSILEEVAELLGLWLGVQRQRSCQLFMAVMHVVGHRHRWHHRPCIIRRSHKLHKHCKCQGRRLGGRTQMGCVSDGL